MKNRFCIQCGNMLAENARFCGSCGATVEIKGNRGDEFFNCPSCGHMLNSFMPNCPACGRELRDVKVVNSVREFVDKLETIEASREFTSNNPIVDLCFGKVVTKTDERIIMLIKSFPIPNTKEDLYEFLILASSNINIDMYDSGTIRPTDVRLAVSDAWRTKFDQAYQKAKRIFAGDNRLVEIDRLYKEKQRAINNAKWRSWKLVGIVWAIAIVIVGTTLGVGFWCTSISNINAQKKESARLEAIVDNIEEALKNKDYDYALMYAKSIECNSNCLDDATERQWKIQREYWIDKIIEEASLEGVYLDDIESEGSTS